MGLYPADSFMHSKGYHHLTKDTPQVLRENICFMHHTEWMDNKTSTQKIRQMTPSNNERIFSKENIQRPTVEQMLKVIYYQGNVNKNKQHFTPVKKRPKPQCWRWYRWKVLMHIESQYGSCSHLYGNHPGDS